MVKPTQVKGSVFLFLWSGYGVMVKNVKTVALLLSGAVIIAAISLIVSLAAPIATAQPGQVPGESSDTGDGLSWQELVAVFRQVESGITDPEIREYYIKLISEYHLCDSTGDAVSDGPEDGQIMFPDIEKIQKTALTLPFQEAGKCIRDPDIKNFYYRFLQDAGLWDETSPRG